MSPEETALLRKRRALFQTCAHVGGHGPRHVADELERVAALIRTQDIAPDVYGTGTTVTAFEAEVATLLGKPAARWMPSGCMAQPIALRIWADRAGTPHTAFHATSHLELHEEHGYSALHGLHAHLLGDPTRPTLAHDLNGLPSLSSLLVELPAREIGGQLQTWTQLRALSDAAREREIHLHLDGARLWEAQAAYDRPHAEICGLFDSVYVSFYKGIGGLPGAMLAGPMDFIEEAAVWQRRQGGTLYSALANIVSAQTRLAPQIAKMAAYREAAYWVADTWAGLDGARVNPATPQSSIFHVHLSGDREALLRARDAAAQQVGVWLFGGLRQRTDDCSFELSMGDAVLGLQRVQLRRAVQAFGLQRRT